MSFSRAFYLIFTVSAAALVSNGAQARNAGIVIDANNGQVLYQSNPDAPRYPASLTKVMTLYLLFERLEAGTLKLNSPLTVSARSASMPPSKLGMKPGEQIRVDDAIMSLVTRSANDIAATIAENLGGSEEKFADLMTKKARQIGMSRTSYQNASGLPDTGQITTARDLALLGRALYERFPQYAGYFARRSFNYEGRAIANHNKLLGRVQGVDGIKTGYTRASGFNLLTSVHADGRHLIAVVMGGATGAQRDATMRTLIASYLPKASTLKKPDNQLIARIKQRGELPVTLASSRREDVKAPQPLSRGQVTFAQAAEVLDEAAEGAPVALAPVPAARIEVAAAPLKALDAIQASPEQAISQKVRAALNGSPSTSGMQWNVGSAPAAQDKIVTASLGVDVPASIQPNGQPSLSSYRNSAAPVASIKAVPALDVAAMPQATGWAVQIAATNSEADAMKLLQSAQTKVKVKLALAKPFTERVVKGSSTMYRARFAGFNDRDGADAACAALKKSDFACMTLRL